MMADREMYNAFAYVPQTPRFDDYDTREATNALRYECPVENLILLSFFSDLTIEYYQHIYDM